jgi:hypothetical protein
MSAPQRLTGFTAEPDCVKQGPATWKTGLGKPAPDKLSLSRFRDFY